MAKEKSKERYSYSKLSSFYNCKLGFRNRYLENKKGINNAFGQYGSFIHSLMEDLSKGKLALWDLEKTYRRGFDREITYEFPKLQRYHKKYGYDMRKLYFQQGLDFLRNFSGFGDIKILEIESEFEFEFDDWIFTGIIDFVYEDDNNKIILLDYKTKGAFKNKKEQAEYARQLYLYSLQIKKKYGKYPDELAFLLVRKQKRITINFDIEDLKETVRWARKAVEEIRNCKGYPPSPDEWFCNELCDQREDCGFVPKRNT